MKRPDRIMIIDDDPMNNVMCKLVIRWVYGNTPVKIFSRPKIAMDSIREEYAKPGSTCSTLLFLDINMPYMSGWEFLEEFKSLDERVKQQFSIHMLTSSIDHSDRHRALEHPLIEEFLSKPLTKEMLTDIKAGEKQRQLQSF